MALFGTSKTTVPNESVELEYDNITVPCTTLPQEKSIQTTISASKANDLQATDVR